MSGKAPTTLSKDTGIPPSVKGAMARGVPKRTAMAKGPKPVSTVKV